MSFCWKGSNGDEGGGYTSALTAAGDPQQRETTTELSQEDELLGESTKEATRDRMKHCKRRKMSLQEYEQFIMNAKSKAGCDKLENGKVNIEENSVYGAAILLPQIARTFGYPVDLTIKAVRAFVYLFLSIYTVCSLILFMSKEENVIDNYAGQMFLCDFGVGFSTEPGPGGRGPGGTHITAARMYSYGDWVTRIYVRDALKSLFPNMDEQISEIVDPGEYGVESHWCRLLCCFVFMLSITQELDLLTNMAKLLWHIPSHNQPWVRLKDHDMEASADRWLEHLDIKVAGMATHWKIWNFVAVLGPKALVFYLTANTGTTFLMESSGIDDVIVNSVALGFLLTLDDLITTSIQSASVKHFLAYCDGFELYDVNEGSGMREDDLVDAYPLQDHGFFHILTRVIPQKMVLVLFMTCFFVLKYYITHCDMLDGRWISKSMYLPITVEWDLIKAMFPFWEVNEDEPYWTMPK